MTHDAVIAGGGPAGSIAALILARAGKKVLVLEKGLFPRPKVCGYALNPRCHPLFQRHGLIDRFRQLPHFDLAGFTLEDEGRAVLRHNFRRDRTRTIDRGELDAWLAGEARAAGADYEFGVTVLGLGPARVQTSVGDFAAPLVIGADGRNSVVGRLSGLAQPGAACSRVGWQSYIALPALDDHVHMNVFPEGYYGLNRIDATRVTITLVLSTAARVTPQQIMARYLPGAAHASWKSIHPISRPASRVTDGRVWLAGDAARVLEPLTGEGIYSALATGEMAARHILSIDALGVRAAAQNYRRWHRRFYGPRIFVNNFVRWSTEDSRRTQPIVRALNLWPTVIARMVEWVQSPDSEVLPAGSVTAA
jgi:flavin-dependent dehydrogenase